jgi:hypothetical protein
MELKKELRIMVKYILAKEKQDNDVVENYVDTLALINETYVEQLRLGNVSQQRELLAFIKEVSEWDKDYSSTNLKLKAKQLLKSNCG